MFAHDTYFELIERCSHELPDALIGVYPTRMEAEQARAERLRLYRSLRGAYGLLLVRRSS